eukprot:gene16822-23028_t
MLHTQRLLLRPLELGDAHAMFEMDSDPRVASSVGASIKPLTDIDQSIEVIKSIQSQYEKYDGVGRLALIRKEDNIFVGWAGLKHEQQVNGRESFIDLGFRLLPKFWGNGYATEAAIALVKYGFEVKKFDKICAYVTSENVKSQHMLIKSGLVAKEVFTSEDGEEIWFELDNVFS